MRDDDKVVVVAEYVWPTHTEGSVDDDEARIEGTNI